MCIIVTAQLNHNMSWSLTAGCPRAGAIWVKAAKIQLISGIQPYVDPNRKNKKEKINQPKSIDCASQVGFLACLVQSQLLQGKPNHAAAIYHVLVNYMLWHYCKFTLFDYDSEFYNSMNLLGAGELVHTLGMKEEMSSVTPPETSAMLQFEKEL